MKYIGLGLLAGLVGYVLVAALSYFLILKFSSNQHDRSLEASMTSVFVLGPLGFVLCFILGYFWAKSAF